MAKSKEYTSVDNRSKVVQEIEISETGAKIRPKELQIMTTVLYQLFPPLDRIFLEAPLCDELQDSFSLFQKSDRGHELKNLKSEYSAIALVGNQSKNLSKKKISSSNLKNRQN